MENQEIKELNLDELHISTENPRTKEAIDEKEAIYKIIFEQKDKIIQLIKSIIEDGWIVNDLPAVLFEDGKYVVYEGNRRISSLKCFFDPTLLPENNSTSIKFKKYIEKYTKQERTNLRKKFDKIPVAVHNSKHLIYKYMEKRHTPNNGKGDTLEKWNTVANERFKRKIGRKTIINAVLEEYEELFKNKEQIPITTLERILKNATAKKKLGINFSGNELHVENKKNFSKILKQFIQDIEDKKINSRNLLKAQDIANYVEHVITSNENMDVKLRNNQHLDSKNTHNKKVSNVPGNKRTKIPEQKGLLFGLLEAKSVDSNESDNLGILQLAKELKNLSKSEDYKKYPICTAMIMRNLLEQSLKYQLKKVGIWDSFVQSTKAKNHNNKEPGLDAIIKYCNGNTKKVFNSDSTIQRLFQSLVIGTGTKDYFDLIVHHPESVVTETNVLEVITNSGLYRVIYFILNEQ